MSLLMSLNEHEEYLLADILGLTDYCEGQGPKIGTPAEILTRVKRLVGIEKAVKDMLASCRHCSGTGRVGPCYCPECCHLQMILRSEENEED